MATIQKRNGSYRILFLHHGKRHTFTLGQVSEEEATAKTSQVNYLLMRIKQGLISVPVGMDIITFVEFDGKPPADQAPQKKEEVTLAYLRDRYLKTHQNGTLEQTTLDGIQLHFKHLVTTLGEKFPMRSLSLGELQQHVDRRAVMKGIRGKLSPATIKKEIITLRTAWNWGVNMGLISGRFPNKGLRYSKLDEKPPFQTWDEIERRIKAGGLKKTQISELWDSLFLTLPEIQLLLEHVKENAIQPWVYPMFCFAAHTGARRSEMIRAQTADVDFEGKTVLIHEKKRAHDKRTTRRVPLTPFLADVLKKWLETHPGGQSLFAQGSQVFRSKTKRSSATPVTPDEAHDHFKRTLAGSKWKVLRGWHICRHSFASNCAARGVDQRLLDAWLGHTTEIRKRYLHLIPSNEQTAIQSVFG